MNTLFSSLISTFVFLLLVNNSISLEEDHHHHHSRQLQGDNNSVLVEAFLCNADFEAISEDQVVNKGDSVRICIKTPVRAKVQGISIAKMIDFFLLREFEHAGEDLEQILLQGGVVASDSDNLSCDPGAELCVLESIPMDGFFGRDGRVSAIGSVLLQQRGDDEDSRTAMPTTVVVTTAPTRAPTIAPTTTTSQNHTHSETSAPTSDPQNETMVTLQNAKTRQLLLDQPKVIVETSFIVATFGNDTGFLTDFREHWDSSPAYVKVLYVFAFIFFFLILFGLGFACLLWAGFCGCVMELLPERFQRRSTEGYTSGKTRDDGTMDESVGAFSPFARNNIKEGVLMMDEYNDEPEGSEAMPRQIFFQRPISASGRTDIETPGGQEDPVPGGRTRKPRNPAGANRSGARKSIRDEHLAQKARLARGGNRQTVNPNRDLAASFLGGFPRRKIASVRTKTPRPIHERNRRMRNNHGDEIPREKTASSIRWLQEKEQRQQLQEHSNHSASTAPRGRGVNQHLQGSNHSTKSAARSRGANQQLRGSNHSASTAPRARRVNQKLQESTNSSGHAPRRGGIVLHGNSIPKPAHSSSTASPQRVVNQQFQGSTHASGLAPHRGGVVFHNGNSVPTPAQQTRPTTPPNKPPITKPNTFEFPTIPEVETVYSDSESDESVHMDVETAPSDFNDIPHGKDNPRPID